MINNTKFLDNPYNPYNLVPSYGFSQMDSGFTQITK